eukprot:jgi/Psemu1/15591/gm1.15591_g
MVLNALIVRMMAVDPMGETLAPRDSRDNEGSGTGDYYGAYCAPSEGKGRVLTNENQGRACSNAADTGSNGTVSDKMVGVTWMMDAEEDMDMNVQGAALKREAPLKLGVEADKQGA